MPESSDPVLLALESWRGELRDLADSAPGAPVTPADQLAVENVIAAGVAMLAGEVTPEPATELSGRPMLAQDLLITTDLVLRALQHHIAGPDSSS